MASSGSRGRRVGRPRGSRAVARARDDSLLDAELASLPAADLIAHLNRRRTSQYAFVEVAHVLHDRERRLAEAEARIRAAELSAAAMEAEIRRAADAKARLRAEVRAWQRRATDAEARLLRGELDAVVAVHEPMLLDEEGRVWFPDHVADLNVQAEGRRDEASRHGDFLAVESESEFGDGKDDAWLNNARPLAMAFIPPEPDHNQAANENVSLGTDHLPLEMVDDREKGTTEKTSETMGSNSNNTEILQIEWGVGAGQENRDAATQTGLTNNPASHGNNAVPGSEATAGGSESGWKIRGTGMFYKMVFKALKEKEMEQAAAAAAKPDYRCWLYAPRPSGSDDMEDPDPETPHK